MIDAKSFYAILVDVLARPKLSLLFSVVAGVIIYLPEEYLVLLNLEFWRDKFVHIFALIFLISFVWFMISSIIWLCKSVLQKIRFKNSVNQVKIENLSELSLAILIALEKVKPSKLRLNDDIYDVKRLSDFGLISWYEGGPVFIASDVWQGYKLTEKGEKFYQKHRGHIEGSLDINQVRDLMRSICRGIE